MLNRLLDVKNVVCPFCGYIMPMIYDKNTNVEGLLVTCKGRQCKQNFILDIKRGTQRHLKISRDIVEEFKQVFGEEYLEHLCYKYGSPIIVEEDVDDADMKYGKRVLSVYTR